MKLKITYLFVLIISCFTLLHMDCINAYAEESSVDEDEDFCMLDEPVTLTHIYPDKVAFYKDGSRSSKYENVEYHIEGNNMIIQVPYSAGRDALKRAYISFEVTGGTAAFDTEDGVADIFNGTNLVITLEDGRTETYFVTSEYLSGDMPVLFINTSDGRGVNSRTEFTNGTLIIDGNEYAIEVRGRGNVSWWGYDQHGYMIKMDGTESLLGMRPSDKFCILSTYGDTSLVRNLVAMNMAKCMDNMEFVPSQRPIDMFIDGKYMGIFTFSEKIDVGRDRVNLFSDYTYEESLTAYAEDDLYDKSAFLIELGGYAQESHPYGLDHFSTAHIHDAFIKYPEGSELTAEKSAAITGYLRMVDQIVTVRDEKLFDYLAIEDWVDWFIVMEYTNSTDSAFGRSTYLYKRPGGKLYVGPVWDFDKALGNYGMDNPRYDTWCSTESTYGIYQNNLIRCLYMSDAFMEMVQIRWDEKKDQMKQLGLDALDDAADDIAFSRPYNDRLYNKPGLGMLKQIRGFLDRRYAWIDASLHQPGYNRHPY